MRISFYLVNSNKKSLVLRDKVCQPKDKGGLGAIDLRLQKNALLLKKLHKLYKRLLIPWVNLIWNTYYSSKVPHVVSPKGSFWWRDVLQFVGIFKGISTFNVGDGKSYLFWEDLWNNKVRSSVFPRIHSFSRDANISVHILSLKDLSELFVLPLSEQALQEYMIMSTSDPMDQLNDEKDSWTYAWGNGIFSSQKIYAMNFSQIQVPAYINWIWKSKCGSVND